MDISVTVTKAGQIPKADIHNDVDDVIVTCKSCNRVICEPILLPCLHSVCKNCITKAYTNKKSKYSLTCPDCGENIEAPACGIDEFQTNYYLTHLAAIYTAKSTNDVHCKVCNIKNKDTLSTYVCITCNDFLCTDCSNAHSNTSITIGHTVVARSDLTSGECQRGIRDNQIIMCVSHPQDVIKYYCETCSLPICRECQLEDHARHTCKPVSKSQACRRETIRLKIINVEEKTKQIGTLHDDVSNTLGDIENRYLKLVEGVDRTSKKLIDQIGKEKTDVLADLKRTTDIQRQTCMERQRQIQNIHSIMEDNIYISTDIVNNGKDDELLFLEKVVRRRLESLHSMDIAYMKVTWNPPDIRSRNMFITDDKLGLFELNEAENYTRPLACQITLGARHVIGLRLMNRLPVTTVEDVTECRATGLAFWKGDTFVVGDHSNRKLKLFTKTGTFLETLAHVRPMDVQSCGDIMAYTDQMSLHLYSNKYAIKKVPLESTRSSYPLASLLDTYLVVADTKSVTFLLYDTFGELYRKIVPEKGTKIRNPVFITTNSKGHIIISDWAKHSVIIMDQSGKLIQEYKFNSAVKKNGWLPGCLCVDQFDNIFVADLSKSRIIVLNHKAEFMFEYSASTEHIDKPRCMACDGRGIITVSGQAGCLNVYQCQYI